jgi:hypothetical protein
MGTICKRYRLHLYYKTICQYCEDDEVKKLIELAISFSQDNVSFLKEFFASNDFPIPHGFNQEDVNENSPKLFSDTFMLRYLRQLTLLGLAVSTAAIGLSIRPDTTLFYKEVLKKLIHLNDMVKETMLSQRVFVKPPWFSPPDMTFVKDQGFLGTLFGNQRPLTTIEITHLYLNVQTNQIGHDLITAFSQVAQQNEVIEYLIRGKGISKKHVEIF